MKLFEVKDKKTSEEFLEVPKILYKNDPDWICPLDAEIENTFNPEKNKGFKHGGAIRWILRNDDGTLAGRIAAFYDETKAFHNQQPTGGIGFFECINDQRAANLLFDSAKAWLESKGMKAMDGPINFGENFVNWGLLVEGFMPQTYGMPYNFPYYKDLFENYGFQVYFNQFSFLDDFSKPYPDRMRKFGEHFWTKPEYTFKHIELKNPEPYLRDLAYMYNTIWADFHESYTPLEYEDLYQIFNDAKAILNEKFIWFAYENGSPIGFLIVFPDVNQVLKKLGNGKLNFINILKLLYYRRRAVTKGRLLLSGMLPEYQRKGVVGGLYIKLTDSMRANGMKALDLSWVGDYNTTVNRMYAQFGALKEKTHTTYRYLFDRNAEFVRFSNLSSKTARAIKNTE